MNMLLKIVAGLLLSVVVLALLASIVFDPNDYKDQIEAELAAATGAELDLAGDLRISLLPRPKLEVDKVILASAPGFGAASFAELSRVWLYPRLGPLFSRRIELQSVHVQGMRLHLIRDEQGRANWDLRLEPARVAESAGVSGEASAPFSQSPPAPPRPPESVQAQGPLAPAAAESAQAQGLLEPPAAARGRVIDSFDAVDVTVTLDDRQTGWHLVLDGAEISTGPIAVGEAVALRLTGSLIDERGHPAGDLQAEGNLHMDANLPTLRLAPVKLQLDGLPIGDGLSANLQLQADLQADPRARRYLTEGLEIQTEVTGKALSGGRIHVTVEAGVALDLDAETLKVEGLSIRSDTLKMHGTAVGQRLLSALSLEGDLVVEAFDLRAWLARRGLPVPRTTDGQTLRLVSLRTGWRSNRDRLALQDLDVEIDQTRISGTLERTSSSPPGYSFDLQADGLDMDRYLPPAGSTPSQTVRASDPPAPVAESGPRPVPPAVKTTSTPAPAAPAASSLAAQPQRASLASAEDAVGTLDLDGRLRVGELKLARLRLGSADLRIRAKDGILDMNTQSEHFYQGRLTGRVGLDLRGVRPEIVLEQRAESIETGPFLKDLTGENRVTGRGDIRADLVAAGRSEEALKRSLSGTFSAQVSEGAVKGFNMERLIAVAQAKVVGGQVPKGLPTQTRFDAVRASGKIQNGILDSRDFLATSDHLRITGEGTVDLVRDWFDFHFEPVVEKAPRGGDLDDLEGIPVPVRLTGTFAHPQWNVDVVSALQAVAERELKGEGGLFKKLEESTGIKGLEQGLRGLFGH